MFRMNENSRNLKQLVKFNVDRTRKLFDKGKGLFRFLSGMLRIEIKWTLFGGEAILNKIEKNEFDVLNNRPELNKTDFIVLLLKSMI
jgi:phytoene/squalene synthetase